MNEPLLEITPPPICSDPARRIRWLISALMASCTLPILGVFDPNEVAWMPLLLALHSSPIGVMLTLAFWVGLGNASLIVRLIAGTVGVTYLIASSITAEVARQLLSGESVRSGMSDYAAQASTMIIALALFSGMFMALRRAWELLPAIEPDAATAPKSQFSLLYVLLLTAGVALMMTLIRWSRDSVATSESDMIATNILALAVFATNAVCASLIALRPVPIRRSCGFVLIVAVLLGLALSAGANHDLTSWEEIAFGPIISVLPTAILLGSLLVVRSAGYRLLRKSTLSACDAPPLPMNA